MLVAAMLCSLLLAAGAAHAQGEGGGGAFQPPPPIPLVAPPVLLSPTELLITEDSTPELWLQAASGHEIVVADADGNKLAGALGQGKQKVAVTLPALAPKLHWLRITASYMDTASTELRVPVYVDGDASFGLQDAVRLLRQAESHAGFGYGPGGASGFMRELLARVNGQAAPKLHWTGFAGVEELSVAVDHAHRYIEVVVPFGTNLASLLSEFDAPEGAAVTVGGVQQASGSTANDFNRPVYYVVSDGTRTATYAVNVIVEPGLRTFGFVNTSPQVMGSINETERTINVVVPYDTPLNGLIAGYETSPDTIVTVNGFVQSAGYTANDFSEPVAYKLQRDGREATYTVTVTEGEVPDELPEMLYFGLLVGGEPIEGSIDGNVIDVTVPHGTELGELLAVFETSMDAVVTVDDVVQHSGDSSQDYSLPVTYVLKAGELESVYTVYVKVDEPHDVPAIERFGLLLGYTTVPGHVYADHTIEVYMPHGTDLTSLAAVYEATPLADVTVGGVAQVNGVTKNDYSSDVVFTVTLGEASASYTVRASLLPDQTPSCIGNLCDLNSWTRDGLWNVLPFDNDLSNGAYNVLSQTRPGDTSGGLLPDGPEGSTSTHALWYGKPSANEVLERGNYLNAWSLNSSMNGGQSQSAHAGSVTSGEFQVTAEPGSVPYLTFNAWWEIEGQDPFSYDLMQVYAVSGGERVLLGNLNDTIEEEENDAATPQTSGGLGAAPIWTSYAYDLSPFVGEEPIRIELRFDTRDANHNAFRGWFVTDVQVKMIPALVTMPPTDGGGRVPNPELPPPRG